MVDWIILLSHFILYNLSVIHLNYWLINLFDILSTSETDFVLITISLDVMLISLPFDIAVEALPVLVKHSHSHYLIFTLLVNVLHTNKTLLLPTSLTLHPDRPLLTPIQQLTLYTLLYLNFCSYLLLHTLCKQLYIAYGIV